MVNYLIKILILLIFSIIIAYFYYYTNSTHIENFNGYLSYIITIGIIYGVYKYLQFEFSEKKAKFSIMKIFGFFLLHLFILSILFFLYNNLGIGSGIALFFKIIYYLFIPTLLVIICLSFGKKITSYLSNIKEESEIYKFIMSLGIGFFSFMFLLDIFGILGFYNLYIVFLILAGFIAFSYKELISIFDSIRNYKFEIDIEEGNYLKLVSTEFLFLVSTLIISISLISIVRPFPIGWDDLGAYMNNPHLMAESASLLGIGGMQVWQTFTGIGYMFGSPTQAFFLNNVGGILSFITLVLITLDLLKSKSKTFINIPMLVGTMFIAMPMIVFQQAKDMKLDAGLFFVSIISVYLLYKYYLKLDNKSYLEKVKGFINDKILHKSYNKANLIIILIIGILSGFAFSIKFTTLLLISGVIGVMSYARLGIIGFIGYLSIYFAIFTKANLWGMMNVTVNPNNIIGFETKFAIISGLFGLILLSYAVIKNKLLSKKYFMEVGVFILGVIVAILPWLGKNIYEASPNISLGTIVWGKGETFHFDKALILSKEEIEKIETEKQLESISQKGITNDEDLGRYFGYQTGVNNYLKLPWNLTMQRNQGGEFTDIGFLFLALLPAILLFLPYRKKYYPFLIVIFLALELLVFIKSDNNVIESNKLSNISQNTKNIIFEFDRSVLKNDDNNIDIYDINVGDYVTKEGVERLVTEELSFEYIKEKAIEAFYKEITQKVLDHDLGKDLKITKTELVDKDFELIKKLREKIKSGDFKFKSEINSLVTLEGLIIKSQLEEDKENLIKIWKESRTINQFFTDIFSKYNLPFGYIIILFVFLLPVFLLIYGLDKKYEEQDNKISLFKLNLIFASFYTFLWTISAFGIVWYGIAMYFAFLLMIAIGAYYITNYEESENENENEKKYYIKLFGSLILFLIFLIYCVNSIIPHSFKNLKGAGYKEYKTGDVSIINAPYIYHREYLKILFYLNIDENKKEEFLKENVTDDIQKLVSGIEKMDIGTIRILLNQVIEKNKNFSKGAKESLNNIYKNVSNPSEYYKNTEGIYRIGTFLKYHISENNKRLLEDSLIFTFNDYIYNENPNTTVENLKKIGLGYLLVDLNAATIDKDARHNLTARYERLLSTFTSENLELVETDSICLKLALEDYSKSEKTSEDLENYLSIAGVNHESYTESGEQIARGTKLLGCYNRINDLINANKIDDKNYIYLSGINNYIKQNKDAYQTGNQIYGLLKQQVKHGYKVLFKIK